MKKILNSVIFKFLSSFKLFIWLCGLLLIPLIIGTLIPQRAPLAQYQAHFSETSLRLIDVFRLYDIYHTYLFYALLLLLAFNAFCAALKRFALRFNRLGSSLLHFSVIIILIGALLSGLAGERRRISLHEGESARVADFQIKLLDFELEVEKGSSLGLVEVNFNGNYWPDLKLAAEPGKVYQLGMTGYALKVLRVFRDFSYDFKAQRAVDRSDQTNNPAVEVSLLKDGRGRTFWLFAKVPEIIHQRELPQDFSLTYLYRESGPVLDFKSRLAVMEGGQVVKTKTIEVNQPLHYKGYSFFQTNYRPEDLTFSGLTVVRDPGVPFVYSGFMLFFAGLVMVLYVNPYLAKRRK